MMLTDTEAAIEAILFASGEPVKFDKIAQTLEKPESEIRAAVSELSGKYEGRGIQLVMFEDSCQLCSREEYETYVKRAMGIRSGTLSNSTMETLAVIAYNQPVTRAFVEQVRGVDSSYVISTLIEKKLIDVCGKLDVPGKPNLYATTDTFLRVFGLSSLSELPKKEFIEAEANRDEENSVSEISAGESENTDSAATSSGEENQISFDIATGEGHGKGGEHKTAAEDLPEIAGETQ